jgi:excisionase family DNA binding protein
MKKKPNAKRFSPLALPRINRDEVTVSRSSRPRFMNLREACSYGGFGRTKAYELIREGKIAAVRLGHRTRIVTASIDKFHDSLPKVTLTEASP